MKIEAYNRLRSAKRYPGESFSEVVLRARWPGDTITARELMDHARRTGSRFTADELDRIEDVTKGDVPPEDKWVRP